MAGFGPLLDLLAEVPDPRRAQGKLYSLPHVLLFPILAIVKDELEAVLARQVCSGRVPLAEAQEAIAADWTAAYNRFVVGK